VTVTTESTDGPKSTTATIARPVLTPRSSPDGKNTYIADSFAGDADMTSGGSPILAQDGEPAGLARVTLAMRTPVEKLPPAPRRLVGLCSWAAAIGILGVIIGIRAVVVTIIGAAAWFPVTAAIIGVVGLVATMGAFVTARRAQVPWVLLSIASLTLIIASILSSVAS
jgi:hypothetical protein